jgi:hypothetical protein
MDGPTIPNPLKKGHPREGDARRENINKQLTFNDDIIA